MLWSPPLKSPLQLGGKLGKHLGRRGIPHGKIGPHSCVQYTEHMTSAHVLSIFLFNHHSVTLVAALKLAKMVIVSVLELSRQLCCLANYLINLSANNAFFPPEQTMQPLSLICQSAGAAVMMHRHSDAGTVMHKHWPPSPTLRLPIVPMHSSQVPQHTCY